MWGLAPVNGYFRVITGEAVVAPGGEITGHITLAAGSVDTKNAKRDEHLRGADFLVTEKYPEITFNLDTLMSAGQGVMIAGMLTVRDVSRSISFPATVVVSDDGAASFQATVEVDRSEYGITVNRLGGMVKLQCSVTLNAVFVRV
jgi:polyisoprenoid-binding protein YceI